MFRRKQSAAKAPAYETVTYPAVEDTDEAVAAKLRRMARETTNGDRAGNWLQIAQAAEDGRLSPAIRREFARGTTFAK